MRMRLVGLLATTMVVGSVLGAAPAVAAPAAPATPAALVATAAPAVGPAPAVTVDFRAIVALSNCSGSLVRPVNTSMSSPALVMTNGHCVRFMAAGEVILDVSSSRTFTLLNSSGSSIGTLRATRLSYATMTGTDVALYRLSQTYAQIQSQFGTVPLTLSATHPVAGTDIKVVSGYWRRIYTCRIDAFVYSLREYNWTWRDSIRYSSLSTCQTIGGTSGSPIVDVASGTVVGVNNTSNEDGQRCTLNNPCEVDQAGNVTVRPGARYGQQTYQINACIGTNNTINLTLPGCTLARP